MPRAYSLDLRKRVVARVATGDSYGVIAATFGISESSVERWSRQARRTGSVAPKQIGGYKRRVLADERDYVLERFRDEPHVTVRALVDDLAARGVVVSRGAAWSFVRSLGLSFKKKRAPVRTSPKGRGQAARTLEGRSEPA